MMRILVLSDSHGDIPSLKMAINNEPEADVIVFLGDGINDFEACNEQTHGRLSVAVKGNCDSYFSPYPKTATEIFDGKNVYCTHGDKEQVKLGLGTLKSKASSAGINIVLFGHTHTPYNEYDDGIYLFNPGSVRQNSYGVVDISPGGILCFHKKIVG